MNRDRDQLVASSEELRIAMEHLGVAHTGKLDPVRVDEKGRLVFFPLWPLGRRGYFVPDEPTAADLREQARRLQWWSKLNVWVPIPLGLFFLVLGLHSGWFFAALGGSQVLVMAVLLTWRRQVVLGLERAPPSELFSYRRRIEMHAASTRLPYVLLAIAALATMVAAMLFCIRFPPGHAEQAAAHSDFGGLPYWAATLLFRLVCLGVAALFGVILAGHIYEAWFLIAHRDEVRRRRHAARLWS